MNRHLSKRVLLFIALFIILLIASFIHNKILLNTLDKKLKTLHASGIYLQMIEEKESVFYSKKDFLIRLDKVELIAELLFGISATDPILVNLSKLQGLMINVHLSHNKFIFSNNLNMYISLHTLPEYFSNQSKLFLNLLEFSKKNPKLIHTSFNAWDSSFEFHIADIKETFEAENNLSFNVDLQSLTIYGYIREDSDFDLYSDCDTLQLTFLKSEDKKAFLNLSDSFINIKSLKDDLDINFAFDTLNLTLDFGTKVNLNIQNLQSEQVYLQNEVTEFSSNLYLNEFNFSDGQEVLSLHDFAYDLALKNLDSPTLKHVKELIHTSNTNTVVFIYDDLSKDIETLIQKKAAIELNTFSFDDIVMNEKHYKNGSFSLKASSRPGHTERPIDFDMNIHLSKQLYEEFLEKVPNASLTKNYLEKDSDSIDFHLQLSEEGLILNQQKLSLKEDINEIANIQNDENDTNQTDEHITDAGQEDL